MRENKTYINLLIEGINKKNEKKVEEAFNIIFENYNRLLYYISFSIVKSEDVANDIVIDSFSSFFTKLNEMEIKNESGIKFYLTTICKNKSLIYARNFHANTSEYDDDIGVNNVSTDKGKVESSILLDIIREVLDEEEYEILIRHALEDEGFREIAEDKGLTTSTVSSRYNRAIIKVQGRLKGHE